MSDASPNDPLTGHPGSRLPTAAVLGAVGTVPAAISPEADIGHVNLTVSDVERAVVFYRDLIGLRVTQRDEDSAFLAAGDYHHHVALNRWDREARPPPPRRTGLHHFGLRLPDRTALPEVVVRLVRAGHPLLGATDHGVNLAVYLADPDGNGLELMVDRPVGRVAAQVRRLDCDDGRLARRRGSGGRRHLIAQATATQPGLGDERIVTGLERWPGGRG